MASTRMGQLVRSFAFQSLMLAAIAAVLAHYTGSEHIYVVAGLTLVVKGLVIPRFLIYSMDRLKVRREIEPLVGIPASLLISGGLVIVAYYITEPLISSAETVTRNCLAVSLAVVLIGLFMMISRRKAMTQMVGLLMMENGLFLGIISTTYGMPLIVEIGIFFDVLMAVLIMGIFAYRINQTFETLDTTFMRRLRG
ncbi:MAG TPA: hydrogenase [Methanomassiliicoccales archaeon]|nr:hydrogenase [Euryarchaeota archaeon]HOE52545.1 hydrogenase [Methanomassiliicoccales archaeon]